MLTNLREINRLLFVISELQVDRFAKKIDVIEQCRRTIIGGRLPNHEDTINFCINCEIIEELNGQLRYSILGKELVNVNVEKNWELNEQQKNILIENCFLDGFLKNTTIEILKQFLPDNKIQTFIFSKENKEFLYTNQKDLQLLLQVELIQEDKEIFYINPKYSQYFSWLISKRKMSYNELKEKMKINKEVGDIAEKIILTYEKNRLRNEENAKPESDLVQIIGGTDVTAGYDIESFDGKTRDLEYNRHIEVKGSTNEDLDFYWSTGEIEKAKEKEKNYWIYFVSGINIKNQTYKKIKKIQNPAKEVFNSGQYTQKCVKYHIRSNNGSN